MSNKPSVIFFGNERLATGVTTNCPTLTKLIEAGFEVKAVISNHQTGVSRANRTLEVQEIATKHSTPHYFPTTTSETKDIVKSYNANIGVLVAFGRIIPQEIIDLFPEGIINLHPSLLPSHRGPTPIESTILSGEEETGVSIIKLSAKMDSGPIFVQKKVKLTNFESIAKQELADSLNLFGAELVIGVLSDYETAKMKLIPQNESNATYDKLIEKSDGIVDVNKTALEIERQIRAYLGWPGSKIKLGDISATLIDVDLSKDFTDRAGSIAMSSSNELLIQTSSGSLVINRLTPEGKKTMTGSEFLAGFKTRLKLIKLP